MPTPIFKSLAYFYVAVALAPLVLIAIALVVVLFRGGDVLLWSMFSAALREPAVQELDKGELITFRTELLALAKDRFNPALADYYAIGVGQLPSGNAAQTLSPGSFDKKYGQFNNILILDKQAGRVTKVFDRRVSIKFFGSIDVPTGKALVIFATANDSNKDGVLSIKDLHGVFVYTPGDAKLRAATGLEGSAVELDEAIDPGSILVRTIVDADKDGSAVTKPAFGPSEGIEEPQVLYRVDLTSFAAAPLVPPSMLTNLQSELGAPRKDVP